jgi:[DsrC]-trisulfide reductase subunit J
MRERLLIFSGLAAFLAFSTLPFWYNAAAGGARGLDLKRPSAAKQCVENTAFMRRSHMALLSAWRDRRVREGFVRQAGAGGRMYEISLTQTCLNECHRNKEQFCDRCHAYVGLSGPPCWDCHKSPAGDSR